MNLLFQVSVKVEPGLAYRTRRSRQRASRIAGQLPFGKALDAELRGIDQIRVAGAIWFSSTWC
jgi:hypothetical protein